MDQPERTVRLVRDVLGQELLGAHLHCSAVLGGLKPAGDLRYGEWLREDLRAGVPFSGRRPLRCSTWCRTPISSGRRSRASPSSHHADEVWSLNSRPADEVPTRIARLRRAE